MNYISEGRARLASLMPRLMRALRSNDADESRRLLNLSAFYRINVDGTFYSDYNLKCAICVSIETRNTELATFLTEQGCSVHLEIGNGFTPLHFAVLHDNYEMVLLILQHRASVNARDFALRTPLHMACSVGSYDSFCALVDAGADIDVADIDQKTPLLHACSCGNTLMALSLLEKGVNVHFKDIRQYSALFYAVSTNPCFFSVKGLKDQGITVKTDDDDSDSPVFHFLVCLLQNFTLDVSQGCDILRLLIESGCKVNTSPYGGFTPLHIAIRCERGELVKILLNAGADSRSDDLGLTPLYYACRHNCEQLVRLLIASGIAWEREIWLHDVTFSAACNEDLVSLCVQESRKLPRLFELSRTVIRRQLAPKIEKRAGQLSCPPLLRKYIKLDLY